MKRLRLDSRYGWFFKSVLFVILSGWSLLTFAVTDTYYFTQPEQQTRFISLTEQLRCLVCQNQSLADSHAPLAEDLRGKVANLIQQGATDSDVVDYMVQRYGEFILYRPPLTAKTALLWVGPFLILLLGLGAVVYFVIRR